MSSHFELFDSCLLHAQDLAKSWSDGLSRATGKLDILAYELGAENEWEEDDDEEDRVRIPLIELFKMGKNIYGKLSQDLDDYVTGPEETKIKTQNERRELELWNNAVVSIKDLRRYLRVISKLLGKGGIYDDGETKQYEEEEKVRTDNENDLGYRGKKRDGKLMRGWSRRYQRRKGGIYDGKNDAVDDGERKHYEVEKVRVGDDNDRSDGGNNRTRRRRFDGADYWYQRYHRLQN